MASAQQCLGFSLFIEVCHSFHDSVLVEIDTYTHMKYKGEIHISISIHMYICVYVCIYVYTYIPRIIITQYICVYTYMYMYIYIHTHCVLVIVILGFQLDYILN